MQEFNISMRSHYSLISDSDLRQTIATISTHNPNLGEKSIDGLLRAQGIIVQRHRIRDALHVVDPEGVEYRLRTVLKKTIQCSITECIVACGWLPQAHQMELSGAWWH